ncbi:hypothetical protein ACFFNY_10580 [Paenibacillus hodogayensis]|uniref:Uncharacterized protein n=1 Tax=Paenibacillus hodogayensis TaxID=279208 RepID=A0ABV5VV27_9BACL
MHHANIIAIETKLLAQSYSRDRTSFLMPEETYEGWVLLAGEKGVFRYTVADEAGEAKVGDVVLCPPGTSLHREMIEKLDFHYVHFRLYARSSEGPIEFPYFGKIVFRNTSRLLSILAGMRAARSNVSLSYLEHLVSDVLY